MVMTIATNCSNTRNCISFCDRFGDPPRIMLIRPSSSTSATAPTASLIAQSSLRALFPFLIVLTSLSGFFGSKELADQAVELLLQVWPKQVADSLSGEIHDVLTTSRGDILTIGAVLAVYFASNG